MNEQRLKEIAKDAREATHFEIVHLALELLVLHAAIQKPAEQCGNCDDYYAASVMQTTEDGVTLCPGCWKECSEASAILTLPAEE